MALNEGQGKMVWGKGVWSTKNPDMGVLDNQWVIHNQNMYMDPELCSTAEITTKVQEKRNFRQKMTLERSSQSFNKSDEEIVRVNC